MAVAMHNIALLSEIHRDSAERIIIATVLAVYRNNLSKEATIV